MHVSNESTVFDVLAMNNYQEYLLNFYTDNTDTAETKTRKLIQNLLDLMSNHNYNEIKQLFQAIKPMRYSGQSYMESLTIPDSEKDMLFNIGYTHAMMDIMQFYTEKLNVEDEIQKVVTKHRDATLSILAKRGTVFHKDLASAIGVSASGLTAVIKQINSSSVKLINVETISKYKLYSLTPAAHKYITKSRPDICIKDSSPPSYTLFIDCQPMDADIQPSNLTNYFITLQKATAAMEQNNSASLPILNVIPQKNLVDAPKRTSQYITLKSTFKNYA